MDQTESNNSRGITTLAHGNRSYPGEMASVRRGKDGKRVVWGGRGEGSLERGGSLMKEVEVAFFFFYAEQRKRRYFVELDPNVQDGANCISIS